MSRRTEEITLRMLGENMKLTRTQWETLRDMLAPGVYQGDRKITLLDLRDAAELACRIDARVNQS